MNNEKLQDTLGIMSDKIECWIFLKNNSIIKKLIPINKSQFQYADKTFYTSNEYCIRKFRMLLIPITRLCLFFTPSSPYPIKFNPKTKVLPNGTIMPIDYKYVTPEQVTERLKQGGQYVKMSMESPMDVLMQKVQFYGIIGGLGVSVFIALKIFGVI